VEHGAEEPSGLDALGVMSYTEQNPDGSAGNPKHVDIVVRDARPRLRAGKITLEKQGFTLAAQHTKLSTQEFYKPENVKRVYYPEMEELIKQQTGAVTVVVLNDIVRNSGAADTRGLANPFAGGGNGVNGYANVVHTDYRAKKSVSKYFEQPAHLRAPESGAATGTPTGTRHGPSGKYMLINAWRNIDDKDPIYNNTLACCDQHSVRSPGDFVTVDVPLTLEATAEQYRLSTHSAPRHKWYYFPHMQKDEVLLFTQFDSDPAARARFCFHTAFDDPTVDPRLPQRQSVEVRVICFFNPPTPLLGADPVLQNKLKDYVREVHPSNVSDLLRMLAQGAANGLLEPPDLEFLVDKAAYEAKQAEEAVFAICAEKGIPYNPAQWHPGPEADAMLEEITALKTFERKNFLEKGKEAPLHVEGDPTKDIERLQRMFPTLDQASLRAVYRGFGGNFETAVEMLTLAIAEDRDHRH
jgi:hypothetical protein